MNSYRTTELVPPKKSIIFVIAKQGEGGYFIRNMEDFLGTWKLIKSVNTLKYFKAIGIVQDPNDDVITETLLEDEDYVVWIRETANHTNQVKFILDEEFQLDGPDGRHHIITISLKENKLVQVQKMDEIETTIINEVQGTNMITTMKCDGVEAQRTYEKVVVPSSNIASTKFFVWKGCTSGASKYC